VDERFLGRRAITYEAILAARAVQTGSDKEAV
jgi:hypothetical protein